MRSGSGRNVIYLSEVLKTYGDQMAAQSGAASYYALEAFARRDAICSAAPQMAEAFKTDIVVAETDSPDMKALIAALRPLAGMEIVANG